MRMSKAGLIACVAATLVRVPAQASPTISPSVIGAARYKNAPPRGWIRHYLGDDRYKIAGKVWKFVSTERDRYFYPPWAPEMLRQSANTVIGFASADDAIEAGYAPASKYRSQLLPDYLDRAEGGSSGLGSRSAKKGTRIVLSDGVSTVLLPSGFFRVAQTIPVDGQLTPIDIILSASSSTKVAFGFIKVDANDKSGVTPQVFRELKRYVETGSLPDADLQSLRGSKVTSSRLSGMKAVTVTLNPGFFPVQSQQSFPNPLLIMAQRGAKAYLVVRSANKSRVADAIINSFQPR